MSPHSKRAQAVVLGGMWLLYALVVMPLWNWTYWDFGDGNYLYIGRRILDGLVPYRDILAPQPPLHLIGSAASQAFGELLFDSALIGARLYALIVRLAASFLVYLCTLTIFRCYFRAVVATAVYLLLPIGFWWSLCVQSENLELVFLLLAFWQIMQLNKRGVIIAGVASAMAMHCNMTAVPYFLCNALFLGARRPRLFLWYAPVALGTWGIGALGAYAWAGSAYLDNVVLNQVGSFPREELLGYSPLIYFKNKVMNEGWKVLYLEGASIAAAIVAIAINWRVALRHERKSDEYRRYEYAAWYSIGMMLSIGFVMKGGTVNYIFVLGEPAVAIFAADTIVRLFRLVMKGIRERNRGNSLRALLAAGGLVVIVGYLPAWENLYFTVKGYQVELPESDVLVVRDIIETYTEPGDMILSPPYYAWMTNRVVAGELAENYLWNIKYWNEQVDEVEGEGTLKMHEVAKILREQRAPLVLLDMKLTGGIPPILQAAEQAYQPLNPPMIYSRHVPLALLIPKGATPKEVTIPERLTIPPG